MWVNEIVCIPGRITRWAWDERGAKYPILYIRHPSALSMLQELTGAPLPPPPPPVDAEPPESSSEEGLFTIDEKALPPSTPTPPSSDGKVLPAVLGAVGALVFAALVALLVLLLLKRRKRNREPSMASVKASASRMQSVTSHPQSFSAAALSTAPSLPDDNARAFGKPNSMLHQPQAPLPHSEGISNDRAAGWGYADRGWVKVLVLLLFT